VSPSRRRARRRRVGARARDDDDTGRRLESHRKGARINVATRDGAAKARERCATPARRHRVVGKI
jgi:hypothetical protein